MTNEDYEDLNDSIEIWESTSKWSPSQLDSLNINFQPGSLENIIGNIGINNIKLENDDNIENILLPGINIKLDETVMVTKKQLPFYKRLKQILNKPFEVPSLYWIVYCLLKYTKLEERNIHFKFHPKLSMKWYVYDIVSTAYACIYSDQSLDQTPIEFLMVVEDNQQVNKHYNGECQLAGDMLIAAQNRFGYIQKDQAVFGMIIKSNLVRFYKAMFTEKYLLEIRQSEYPTISTNIYTFPSRKEQPLSLYNYEDREKIIKILCALKQNIKDLVA